MDSLLGYQRHLSNFAYLVLLLWQILIFWLYETGLFLYFYVCFPFRFQPFCVVLTVSLLAEIFVLIHN